MVNYVNQDIIDSSAAEFTSNDKDPQNAPNYSLFAGDPQIILNKYEETKNNTKNLEMSGGINETCFFNNQPEPVNNTAASRIANQTGQSFNKTSNFENTKSHDAFFQSSLSGGKLLANLQMNE